VDTEHQRPRFAPAEGLKRLRLTLAYDGTPWRGWQTMPHGQTVQDALNSAFLKVAGVPVKTQGSGRTDAGVHALAQVAHADVPETASLAPESWLNALNACLPPSIRVREVSESGPAFHARFHAVGKVYRYRIWRHSVMSPFEIGRAWQVYGPLNESALKEAAMLLLGTHDFTRLSANRAGEKEVVRRQDPLTTTRTIRRVEISSLEEDVMELEFEGDGFLYKMVRLLTGSLMHVARDKADLAWFRDLLDRPREGLKSHLAAPADGLYLVEVKYA
jgi:tRNA pseudouridine38-40 synthase